MASASFERHRDRLLHQHRLAELQRLAHRRGVLAFRRRDEDRVHLRMRDDLVVVAGMELRAGLLGQRLGARRVGVGDRDIADGRMLGRKPRAQRADPAGADHRNAEIVVLHDDSPISENPGATMIATQAQFQRGDRKCAR